MNQNKRLMVIAQFEYRDPKTGRAFHTLRGWPCRDRQHAELIVRYHGFKTGSVEAKCNLEEFTDEEIKQAQTTTATKEENKKKSTA